MSTRICSQADENAGKMENNMTVSEMMTFHEKMIQALEGIVEKENELLNRLDHLIEQFDKKREKPVIESEVPGRANNIFITDK